MVYLILSAARAFAGTLIFTVLAVYYVTVVKMNPLQLVLVGTALEATIFLFEIPTGVVADTYSRRLSVIVGLFILGAAFLFEGLVPLVIGVMIAEVVRGIGETFLSGATDAWLAGEVGEERLGAVYIRANQVSQAAALLGPIASVGLASVWLQLPILVSGAINLLLGVFLLLAMPETGFKPVPRDQRTSWRALGATFHEGRRTVRGSPLLLSFLGVSLCVGLYSEGFDRLWEAHFLTNFSFPALGSLKLVTWFGIIELASSLLGLAAMELFRRRVKIGADRGTGRKMLVVQALSIACVFIFALAPSFGVALGTLLATRIFGMLAGVISNTWLVQSIDPRVRATVLSMSGLTNAFGQTVGGPITGAVGTIFSIRAALATSGLLLSPLLALYTAILRRAPAKHGVVEHGATALS
jgi:DHA3 family tetracycline resistance protein-like MFS transporter